MLDLTKAAGRFQIIVGRVRVQQKKNIKNKFSPTAGVFFFIANTFSMAKRKLFKHLLKIFNLKRSGKF